MFGLLQLGRGAAKLYFEMALWARITIPASNIAVANILHVHEPTSPLVSGQCECAISSILDVPMSLRSRVTFPTPDVAHAVVLHVQVPLWPLSSWDQEFWVANVFGDEDTLITRVTFPAPNISNTIVLHVHIPIWPFFGGQGKDDVVVWRPSEEGLPLRHFINGPPPSLFFILADLRSFNCNLGCRFRAVHRPACWWWMMLKVPQSGALWLLCDNLGTRLEVAHAQDVAHSSSRVYCDYLCS